MLLKILHATFIFNLLIQAPLSIFKTQAVILDVNGEHTRQSTLNKN